MNGQVAGPLAAALLQPQQQRAVPPCAACAAGTDVRGWMALVAQRRKLGLAPDEALRQAFQALAAVNPFPATLGRICPHPCEDACNRAALDGPVAVHALERYLGDRALAMGWPLPGPVDGPYPESIGVIGAGPAGLCFAYHMLRRGYRVSVYEQEAHPGGMLWYGIPEYRLPGTVLEAEIARLGAMGLDLHLGTRVADRLAQDLIDRHDAVFVGIGAGLGARLGIPGEEGVGVLTGADYLGRVNRGEPVALDPPVIVVGGGNTAMDAARTARRAGLPVTVAYRRTRDEMPAAPGEVEDAMAEGVEFRFLCAPAALPRRGGSIESLVVQQMEVGAPEADGRRGIRAVPHAFDRLRCGTLIAAVSQVAAWDGLLVVQERLARDEQAVARRLWSGGDVRRPGIAGEALSAGRRAAEDVHSQLRGIRPPADSPVPIPIDVKPDHYVRQARVEPHARTVAERLAAPDSEVEATMTEDEFFTEVERCFSCGSCFGCELCFIYCNAGGARRRPTPVPGAYFELDTSVCEGCRKCLDLCPCGYLVPSAQPLFRGAGRAGG
ncbi:MAG: FAD-dependent oxidoreductase [Burkholderiales bacterium]|nr:FAD-dependent oxidoreductase [Burkholderiales bacterium]